GIRYLIVTGVQTCALPIYYLQSRFDEVPAKAGRPARTRKQNMELPGIPWTRWFDATLANPDDVDQRDAVKGVVIMGHGGNTVPQIGRASCRERGESAVVVG